MKKILLSSLIAAAAAVPAVAGVNDINYQAVIKNGNSVVASQTVEMKFELVDQSENVVYTEMQAPTTNAAGYVSCQLSGDELSTIEWGDLTLRVSINLGSGFEVISNETVSSVPTALYALRTAETDNLREEIDAFAAMNETRIDKIQKQVDDIDGSFANLGENLDNLVTEMNANFEGVNGQIENLNMVAAVVRENEAAIEELNTNTDAFATMLETRLDKMQNQVDGIDEALTVSGTTDYSALVKDLEALKVQTEEGLAKVEVFADAVDEIEGIVQENEETKSRLNAMSADVAQIEGIAKEVEDLNEQIDAFATMNETRIDKLQNQADATDKDLENIKENLTNAFDAKDAEIAEINGQLENLNNVAAVTRANEEAIEELQGDFKNIGENLTMTLTEVNTRIDGVDGQLENLQNFATVVKEEYATNEAVEAFATMNETRIDKLQKQVDGLEEEVATLKDTLNQLIEALKDLDILPSPFNAGK